jgi:fibronectin type 3 domain-containing protein
MWAGEKVVVVTVCKIFNWEATREQLHFHLSFHSIKTQTLLMEKKISGKAASNEVQFNYSLRISYAPDENEVLLTASRYS